MNVLVISTHAQVSTMSKDDHVMVVRPLDALFGHRFDLIVAPAPEHGTVYSDAYTEWWENTVTCRLNPDGRVVLT